MQRFSFIPIQRCERAAGPLGVPAPEDHRSSGPLVALIVLGGFMAGLDSSLANVGLVAIAKDLESSLDAAQWAISGYLLALAAALPACPWLQRRFGDSRLWLIALAAFTLASLACAVSPNLVVLITARVVQGAAGGLLLPTGQKIVGSAVGLDRMGRTLSVAARAIVLAPATGPALGGLLIDAMSWRWLFAVNLPLGIATLALALRVLPRDKPDTTARLDVVGLALLSIGLPALSLGLTQFSSSGSQGPIGLVLTVLGTALLTAFVADACRSGRSQTRARLLDVSLFRRPSYATAQVTVFLSGLSMFGGLILLPMYYETLRSQTAFETGFLLLAYGLGALVALPLGGRLTDRIGGGVTCMIGLTITIIATTPFVFLPADANLVLVEMLQAVRGVGVGLTGIPAMTSTFRAAAAHLTDATTTANILQRLGGSLGSAMIAIIVARTPPDLASFQASHAVLVITALVALVAAAALSISERGKPFGAAGVRQAD